MTLLHLIAGVPFERDGKHRSDKALCDEAGSYQIPSTAIEKTLDLTLGLTDDTDRGCTYHTNCHSWFWPPCYGDTALALAIASENWVVACGLHKLGLAFETARSLHSLLTLTVQAGVPELVQLLIENGADVNPGVTTPRGGTITERDLMAVGQASILCVAVRSAKGGGPDGYNQRAHDEREPNHLVTGGHSGVVIVLLDAGADIASVDRFGRDALEYAVVRAVTSDPPSPSRCRCKSPRTSLQRLRPFSALSPSRVPVQPGLTVGIPQHSPGSD